MATYAVGDLQGCLTPLQRLLDKLHFDPTCDQLWLCGDLVNRGPQSLASLRFVRELSMADAAIAVLGNHDLTVLAAAEGYVKARGKDTFQEILTATDAAELLDWLRHQPLLHHDVELGFAMLHAGLAPQWDLAQARTLAAELESVLRGPDYRDYLAQMFGDQPIRWCDRLRGVERLRCITNILTRMRYCTADGELSLRDKGPPGSQPAHLLPWFQVPGRRSAGQEIIFGHWASLGEYREPGIYALDSGCVWGGRLTALHLDGERRGESLSVACS